MHGVSLTVNSVDGARFTVNLIPHAGGDHARRSRARGKVNLEVDLVARYVEGLQRFQR